MGQHCMYGVLHVTGFYIFGKLKIVKSITGNVRASAQVGNTLGMRMELGADT